MQNYQQKNRYGDTLPVFKPAARTHMTPTPDSRHHPCGVMAAIRRAYKKLMARTGRILQTQLNA